jgi:hypothetical protein
MDLNFGTSVCGGERGGTVGDLVVLSRDQAAFFSHPNPKFTCTLSKLLKNIKFATVFNASIVKYCHILFYTVCPWPF